MILDPHKFQELSLKLNLLTRVGSFEFQIDKNNESPTLTLIRVYEYSRASRSLIRLCPRVLKDQISVKFPGVVAVLCVVPSGLVLHIGITSCTFTPWTEMSKKNDYEL